MVDAKLARTFVETVLARRPDGGVSAGTSEAETTDHVLDQHLRMQLADLLHEDIVRLRRYMPADFDGWGDL